MDNGNAPLHTMLTNTMLVRSPCCLLTISTNPRSSQGLAMTSSLSLSGPRKVNSRSNLPT